MDLKTYNTILQARGENPHEIPDGTATGDSRGHLAFRRDLVKNKVVWYNDPKADWHAFIRNYHPLYSICGAPKEHPFSRKERFFVFIAHNVLAAILSMFIAQIVYYMEEDEADSVSMLTVNTTLSCIAGLIKALSNGILKYMMVCPCCEKESCSSFCRKCWGAVGHCLLCLWYVVILFMLLIMVIIAVSNNIFRPFIYSFIISNVSGWFFSLLLLTLCFGLKWKKEKKNDHKLEEKFRITYHDYERFKGEGDGVTGSDGVPPQQADLTVSTANAGQSETQQAEQLVSTQQVVQQPQQPQQGTQIVYVQQPPQQYGQPMSNMQHQQQYVQPLQPFQPQQHYVQTVQQPQSGPIQVVYVTPNQQTAQQHPAVHYQQQQPVQQVYVQQMPQQEYVQQPHTTIQ